MFRIGATYALAMDVTRQTLAVVGLKVAWRNNFVVDVEHYATAVHRNCYSHIGIAPHVLLQVLLTKAYGV